jgi:NTE family protein
MTDQGVPQRDFDIVLALSGGNALGAFEAGAYQALHEHDLLPDWIVGASIGAINGALIAGSPVADRIDTLRSFWQPVSFGLGAPGTAWLPSAMDVARRSTAAMSTMMLGRPGLFGPLLSSLTPWSDDRPSMFETEQLAATLDRLVDFELLNNGDCRYTATAVDLATGDDVVFDSHAGAIDARHIRASAALPMLFPPVEIDDRWLIDGGISANLPLDPILSGPGARPQLCLAIDLLPLGQELPATVGEAASRMQDLIFAAQSRRTVERWQMAHAGNDEISLTLVRIAYADQGEEVAGKAMDFSGPTIERRWAAGYKAMLNVVDRLHDGSLQPVQHGFHAPGVRNEIRERAMNKHDQDIGPEAGH